MKYHSPISVIIISISVLLIFSAVALVAVFSIGMTSPTLIAADMIMDELSSAPGPVSFSFGSINRNFRDGVFINDLDISYDGESVLSLERVDIHMGLFSLIRFAVTGNGRLSIEGVGGKISIPEIESGECTEEGKGGIPDFSFPSALESYSISFHMLDSVIEYGGAPVSDSTDIFIDINGEDKSIGLETSSDDASFSYDGYTLYSENLLMSLSLGNQVDVSLSATLLDLASDSFTLSVERPAISYNGSALALSLASSSFSYENIHLSTLSSSLLSEGERSEIVITSPYVLYDDIAFRAGEADSIISGDSISAVITSMSIDKGSEKLLESSRIEIFASLEDKKLQLSIPSLESSALASLGIPYDFVGSSISATVDFSAGVDLSSEGTAILENSASLFDGTSASFSLSAFYDGSSISEWSVELPSVSLPYIDVPLQTSVRYDDNHYSLSAVLGDYLDIKAEYDESISLDILSSELPLNMFKPYTDEYLPVVTNYIGEDTKLSGTLSISIDNEKEGPAGFAFTISNMLFRGIPFSAGASLSGYSSGDRLDISSLALTTEYVRASYEGSVSYTTFLPEGTFIIAVTETGKELFIGNLELVENNEYSFSAEIPYFENSWLRGNVSWNGSGLVSSSATLNSGGYLYPFDIIVDFSTNSIILDNEMLTVEGEFGEEITALVTMDDFKLPVFSLDGGAPSTIGGDISLHFSFREQTLSITSELIQVGNIRNLPGAPELSFSFRIWNDGLEVNEIVFRGEDLPDFIGSLSFDFRKPSIAAYFTGDGNDERLLISILRMDDGMYSGLLRLDSFMMDRLGLDGIISNVNLTARATTWDSLSFTGDINAYSSDMVNEPMQLSAMLGIDSDSIEINELKYASGNLTIESPRLEYSAESGIFDSSFKLRYMLEKLDRDYPITSSFTLSAELMRGDNLYRAIEAMIESRFYGSSADLVLDTVDIDGRLKTDKRYLSLLYSESGFDISGTLASGFINTESGNLDLYVDLSPIAVLSADGSTGSDAMLHFLIDEFEISIADLFLDPTIVFYDPAPASGEIYAKRNGLEWNLFGYLEADEVAFDVFWMPDERVILHNPYFVIWDNTFSSLVDDCTVISLSDMSRTPARVTLDIPLGDNLSMLGWHVNVYVDDGNWVGIRLPMTSNNMDLWASVTGHVYIGSPSENILELTGDVKARDVTLSIGMEPLPEWMTEGDGETIADLSMLLTENARFVFPLGSDPILRADVAENQTLRVAIQRGGNMDITGSLDIRSGEFFYFQKNFYITEGNISFRSGLMSQGGFDPVINLRARLRDFDADGNDVDIYLILRNATMDNISPSFESSPSKPISEIMQILGQSILPNNVYSDISVSSMVSLVSASVDILTRLGLVQSAEGNSLESAIRNSLTLDTFSLHSNILENLIFDTVAYASSNFSSESLSPMARYLNGTTLYLGKYLSPSLYLEGMIHLAANPDQTETKHTFLADDLDLDIEVSLEWDNPLALFTFFIQPTNLTLYDMMDSFGFGVSKRIVW